MATYNKFQVFVENLAEGIHDLGADTLKVGLSNTLPVATNEIYGNITEITAQNGYAAGGSQASITSSAHTTGTYKLVLADVTETASGGSFGPLRYAVLYNDTPGAPVDPLIAWWDYGSSITILDTETFTTDFDPSNGVLTLQ